MEDYVVPIPSYKRAEQLRDQTLVTLKDANIAANRVAVFVADEAESDMYKSTLVPGTYGELIVGRTGITNQRDFISMYYPEGRTLFR